MVMSMCYLKQKFSYFEKFHNNPLNMVFILLKLHAFFFVAIC